MDLHILYDSEQKICLSYGDKNSIDIKYSSLCNEFSKNGLETINLKKINLKEFLKKYECNDVIFNQIILAIMSYNNFFSELYELVDSNGDLEEFLGLLNRFEINEPETFICPQCGCTETQHTNSYYEVPYGEIEYTLVCQKCGFKINNYAYGKWELENAFKD